MRKIYAAVLLLASTTRSEAYGQGPESTGTGCSGVTMDNVWSCGQNPSLLSASPPSTRYGIQQRNRFRIGNWNDAGIALTSRMIGPLGTGLQFSQEGIPGYRSTLLLAGIGTELSGSWQTGISIGLRQDRIGTKERMVKRTVVSHVGTAIDLGTMTRIAVVADDLQDFIGRNNSVPTSAALRTGLSIQPSETLNMILELIGRTAQPSWSAGFIYYPANGVAIRIGYDGSARQLSGGLGFRWKSWSIDTAFCHQSFLGTSTSLGITYTHSKHED